MAETYQALYRKWRPMVFEDVVGQTHVDETLKNSVETGRIAHAYLFCGTRGTGKTSTAKIFSRAVNCLNSQNGNPCNECSVCRGILDGSILDVYEMDAASNSGIDNIRKIRDEVIYAPADCKYKVYIVDEAHMLTTESFNALLKTLEEPPPNVIFILATTEPNKIPPTILSRCQRFDFRRIGIDDILRRINKITAAEKIEITPDAAELVAELADGSMRDALSILDQCAAYTREKLSYADIVEIVGIADRRKLFGIVEKILDNNCAEAITEVEELLSMGKEVFNLFDELIMHFRALMICKAAKSPEEILEKTDETLSRYKEQAQKCDVNRILYSISVLGEYLLQAKRMSTPKIAAEMAVVKLCTPESSKLSEALQLRIEKLESDVRNIMSGAAKISAGSSGAGGAKPQPQQNSFETKEHISDAVRWAKWPEALKRIKQESKSLYIFLFKADALYFGDEIEIVLENAAAFEKINTSEGKKYLSDLFSAVAEESLNVVVSQSGNLKKRKEGASILDIAAKKDLLGDKMTITD